MTGHAVNPSTTGRDRVDVELHHFAVRVEFGQQVEGFGIRFPVTELRGDDCAVDHEVVDVAGGEVLIVFAEPALALLTHRDSENIAMVRAFTEWLVDNLAAEQQTTA